MSNKMILVSDIHIGLYQSSDIWHNVVINLFKDIKDTCERNNIKVITFLGDWFDNRKSINLKSLLCAIIIAELLKDYQINLIIGNHDTFYKDRIIPHSISIYNQWNNINIIDSPYEYDNIIMLPWMLYDKGNIKSFNRFDIAMGHLEINGFPMSSNYIFKDSQRLNASDFKIFHKVYSGHFHIPSKKNNIRYIGAPFQQTFNDADGIRGYYIYENGETNFIEFTKYPKFVKMSTEDIKEDKIKGNIIKLIFTKDYGKTDNNNIIDRIQSFGPLQFQSDFSNVTKDIDIKDDVDNITIKNNKEILFDTIDTVEIPKYIKIGTLKKVINTLLEDI